VRGRWLEAGFLYYVCQEEEGSRLLLSQTHTGIASITLCGAMVGTILVSL
jgi:hypothetical protein